MVIVDECRFPVEKRYLSAPGIGRALSWFTSFRFQAQHSISKGRSRLFIVKKAFNIQQPNVNPGLDRRFTCGLSAKK
jgi:hypothetical protein